MEVKDFAETGEELPLSLGKLLVFISLCIKYFLDIFSSLIYF